jgi:hypothetical protein
MDTGLYRIDIAELEPLSITDYERIFKMFSSEGEKTFFYYNILKKIDFPEISPEFLGERNIQTKTPMTTVSFDIYGDIKSWWIIYLLNKELFIGAPFWIDSGSTVKYILPEFRSLIYNDITRSTIFGGRHF